VTRERERIVYLDNAATTPADPAAVEAMLPCFGAEWANPSSVHGAGVRARRLVERAREQVARAVAPNVPCRVVFTSGGTEANNLALLGLSGVRRGDTLVVSAVEHPSVREAARAAAARHGLELREAPVDAHGVLDLERFAALVGPGTALVALIHGQNETGVLQPVVEAARLLRERAPRAFLHVDAIQSFGKVPLAPLAGAADSVALSAHKVHGPKGIGALALFTRSSPQPQALGGGQEQGLRSGTENVPGIVGFGVAAERAAAGLEGAGAAMARMSDAIRAAFARVPDAAVLGADAPARLPSIVAAAVPGVRGEVLQHHLERLEPVGFTVGTGSACHAARAALSATYAALGLGEELARSVIRVSVAPRTAEEDVAAFCGALPGAVATLRELVR
jgi:cysteine desulfurase